MSNNVDETIWSSDNVIISFDTLVLITHNLNVHQSLNQTNRNLKATLLLAHIVAVLGIVIEVAAVNVNTVTSPVPAVAFLNAILTGSVALGSTPAWVLIAIVSALHALEVDIVRLANNEYGLSSLTISNTWLGWIVYGSALPLMSVHALACANVGNTTHHLLVVLATGLVQAVSIAVFIASQLA